MCEAKKLFVKSKKLLLKSKKTISKYFRNPKKLFLKHKNPRSYFKLKTGIQKTICKKATNIKTTISKIYQESRKLFVNNQQVLPLNWSFLLKLDAWGKLCVKVSTPTNLNLEWFLLKNSNPLNSPLKNERSIHQVLTWIWSLLLLANRCQWKVVCKDNMVLKVLPTTCL